MVTCGEKVKIQKTITVHAFRHGFAFPLKVEQIFGSSVLTIGKITELGPDMNELGEIAAKVGNNNG